uniref:Uncharacterized protein n=1 Tax=Myotis myotis TaxID=51298 RepID=A0A7J7UCY9_MYOMY|nr:hypothetical protein mMyoMyo1_008756 [Myotis myotis]
MPQKLPLVAGRACVGHKERQDPGAVSATSATSAPAGPRPQPRPRAPPRRQRHREGPQGVMSVCPQQSPWGGGKKGTLLNSVGINKPWVQAGRGGSYFRIRTNSGPPGKRNSATSPQQVPAAGD